MKRWIGIPAAVLIIISAGQALTTQTPATQASVTQASVTQASVTQTPAPEALAQKSGCFECHSVDKHVVGPAFHDVAARYKDVARARDALSEKVKQGGKGNWTHLTRGVPMPPHSGRLSDADIKRLVDWVLSLKESETR